MTQLMLDVADGYEATEDAIERLAALGLQGKAAAGQLRRTLAGGMKLDDYFDTIDYEAMFAWWGRSLGLPVLVMMAIMDDAADHDDPDPEPLSFVVLADPVTHSKPWREHRVISLDNQIDTVEDWEDANSSLTGVYAVEGIEVISDPDSLRMLEEQSLWPEQVSVLFVELLMRELAPELRGIAHSIGRKLQMTD